MISSPRRGPGAGLLGAVLAAALAAAAAAPAARAATSLGGQRVGTSAGTFLKIGVGARPVGMGEAFVAVANDPSTIYWNPAGLAGLPRNEVTFSHTEWPADVNYEFAAAVLPSAKLGGVLGIQFGALYTEIDETDELHPYGTGRTFTYTDFVGGLSYARRFTDKLLIGATAKFVHENLGLDVGGTTINNFLVDVGSIYYVGYGSLRVGVALANFGPDFKPSGLYSSPYADEQREYDSFNPPTQFRFGLAWEPIDNPQLRLTTAAEVTQPADNEQEIKLGLEGTFRQALSLRAGYNFNADEIQWSAGAGAYADLGTRRCTADYAYSDGGLLGRIHRLSLGVRF
jgi:opacity protein-like surface antigen